MSTSTSDAAKYREMSLPFENEAVANQSVTGLLNEIKILREKYKARDLHVIVSGAVLSDGEEQEVFSSAHFGDPLRAEAMCAWGMARAAIDRRELVELAMKSGARRRK